MLVAVWFSILDKSFDLNELRVKLGLVLSLLTVYVTASDKLPALSLNLQVTVSTISLYYLKNNPYLEIPW